LYLDVFLGSWIDSQSPEIFGRKEVMAGRWRIIWRVGELYGELENYMESWRMWVQVRDKLKITRRRGGTGYSEGSHSNQNLDTIFMRWR